MKVTVYYDPKGHIQSVVLVHDKAHTVPKSVHHASLDIDVDDVSPEKLAEIHSQHHVDTVQRKLVRH